MLVLEFGLFLHSSLMCVHCLLRTGLGDLADGDSGRHCVCSHSGKGFGKSNQLLCHVRTHHSGELPFACGNCRRRYVKASDLTQHAKSHSAVKPHRTIAIPWVTASGIAASFPGPVPGTRLSTASPGHRARNAAHTCRPGGSRAAYAPGKQQGLPEAHQHHLLLTLGSERPNLSTTKRNIGYNRTRILAIAATHGWETASRISTPNEILRRLHTLMWVQTGERPFACGACHKRFSQKSTLNHHAKMH
ncbi:zinc finger protein 316-like [Ischnura elegans]|uniref:zinc finger protein 316-like n=1 Tax=Ischnura elegans TaxID=197161 RepID=UPI001ED88A89|nr:zinc finger protein 316-like [Ischnura elegans]